MKYSIEIQDSNETFFCDASQNVLEGMVRLGRRGIPSGCRGGACGICKVEVLQGDYRSKRMSRCHVDDEDLVHDRVLACRINPDSDLVIRVIGKMKARFEPTSQNKSQSTSKN